MATTKSTIGPYSKNTALVPSAPKERKETRSGESTYEIWLSRINATLRWRQGKYDKEWERAYKMFKGKHWRDISNNDPASDDVRDRITVNVTMSSVLNLGPFLMQANPEYICKPRKPETDLSAQLQSKLLNYECEQREIFTQAKRAVYDALNIGHGIIKTGYILELDQAINKAEGEIVYEDYIQVSAPFAKRISPFHFLIDPTASENNLQTARWCAEIFYKTKNDIVNNSKYEASVRNKIKNGTYEPTYKNSVLGASEFYAGEQATDDPTLPEAQLVQLYEIWDKKYKKYYIFADGVCEPLLEKDWPYEYLDGFPYIKIDYIEIPDDLYGVGVPYCMEDQQFELNRVRTGAFDHRRRFHTRKYEVLKAVEETELNKLTDGEDGATIRVNQLGSIGLVPDAPLPQDGQIVEAMIRADIQEQTGLDALLRGGQLPSRTTAGEVSTRTSLFRLKLDDRVEAVDKFMLSLGKQILQHIKANFTSERVIQIVGDSGMYWEPLTPEMIRDEVDVSMESISAPKIDPMLDRQQALQVWQICMQSLPLMQAGVLKIDMNQLFKWLMEKMGIKDAGRFFNPSLVVQPPMDETTQQQGAVPTQPNPSEQPPDFSSLFQQIGGANAMNQSGLQLG